MNLLLTLSNVKLFYGSTSFDSAQDKSLTINQSSSEFGKTNEGWRMINDEWRIKAEARRQAFTACGLRFPTDETDEKKCPPTP